MILNSILEKYIMKQYIEWFFLCYGPLLDPLLYGGGEPSGFMTMYCDNLLNNWNLYMEEPLGF
jgi:hypothetical protein